MGQLFQSTRGGASGGLQADLIDDDREQGFLFRMPEITATGNNATLFSSGVMVIGVSNCPF